MTQEEATDRAGSNSANTDAATDAATTNAPNLLAANDPSLALVCIRIRDLVSGMAEALVDHPEQVSVEAIPEPNGTLIRLRVATEDIGKVIGKQGRTARSMRTILSAASMKIHHRFALDIIEDPGSPHP